MKFNKKECIFILLIVCLLLVLSSNLTYSKFTYSKEVSGSLVTAKPPTFVDTLIDSARNNLDTNVDFNAKSSSSNGVGLMMREGTQNNTYPIIYYRGNIINNNVIFADLCWLIVRTTETSGIKLLFNGPVVENTDGTGSCTEYYRVIATSTPYTDVYAGNTTTTFNKFVGSPVYGGYMYNDVNYTFSRSTLATDYVEHLSNNNIDGETGRHIQNLKDSTIKEIIDTWYEANILGKPEETLLEDTVWCNDRSVISETYSIENYTNNSDFYFAARTRLDENITKTPSLSCERNVDKFTVDSENGNGDLDYKVGLLTADEVNLAGHPFSSSQTTYLKLTSGGNQYLMSPSSFYRDGANHFLLQEDSLIASYVFTSAGARPSISLNNSVTISGGNGYFSNPYIISP